MKLLNNYRVDFWIWVDVPGPWMGVIRDVLPQTSVHIHGTKMMNPDDSLPSPLEPTWHVVFE